MTMLTDPSQKYRPFAPVHLRDRTWPDAVLSKAPIWLSTDLRDGNQSLIEPMNAERKLRMFELLVRVGFKEIEVGFPSASQTEFDFHRHLIDHRLIPDDVTIQVLTPARDELIRRSFQALRGVPRAIVHVYNAMAPVMRRVVFRMSEDEVVDLAVSHVRLVRELADAHPETDWRIQYSPEMFSGTELALSKRVVDAVVEAAGATPERPIIINLPSTVEHSTPNIFADMIEWMHRNIARRDAVILSIHPHNDRGTGIAAGEFALMAGGDRIEGCLFGNGERTGNFDVVNLALNLYTQGVHPGLDFSDIDEVRRTVEHCNQLPVHPRHPYVGDLVFTSFSGSHQDAIKKGFASRKQANSDLWEIPYLPIDPADLGRNYDAVIRVNSQSGKGGVAYLLQEDYGIELPRMLQVEFSKIIQAIGDETGKELTSEFIYSTFVDEYLEASGVVDFVNHETTVAPGTSDRRKLSAKVSQNGVEKTIEGTGTGPIDAYMSALKDSFGIDLTVNDYREHTTGFGADAVAVAYVEMRDAGGDPVFGVGRHANIVTASLKAITSAVNRAK